MTGRKQSSPSADRNMAPILAVLETCLPAKGTALEIGSGSGQHVAAFAANFPEIIWTPSDPDAIARESIKAWAEEISASNLEATLDLDVTRSDWPEGANGPYDVMLSINMVHISPWAATVGLMMGAGRLLNTDGLLYLYGPFRRGGEHTAESNIQFEGWLKGLDPAFGVRDLEAVEAEATSNGLSPAELIEMPANNFSVLFRKT